MDELAKRALKKLNIEMQVSICKADVKCLIWGKNNNQVCQERRDKEEKGRHLYQIQKCQRYYR